MSRQHTEHAFETAIEHHLVTAGGYEKGDHDAFDLEHSLFTQEALAFIKKSQPKEWEYLYGIQKDKAEETLLDDLCRALNSEHEGSLAVLRHGFKCFGKLFRVAYFAPASGMNPETTKLYAANRLTITRQLRYSAKHGNTLDVTLALNGIPVATVELKNPMTGQTWRNAIHQYKNDRDPTDLIFQFKKRTLVHFAMDTDEVYMTTRLSGNRTYFLPFNLGCRGGAGNPENPGGYKTAYLWGQVLERHSFLDVLARFIHLQVEYVGVYGHAPLRGKPSSSRTPSTSSSTSKASCRRSMKTRRNSPMPWARAFPSSSPHCRSFPTPRRRWAASKNGSMRSSLTKHTVPRVAKPPPR